MRTLGGPKAKVPPLGEILDRLEHKPEPVAKPRTFNDWFAALGPWTDGVPPPPDP